MLGDDVLRAFVQVARAAVVAKPRPGDHHVVDTCRGKGLDRRPALQKRFEIRNDRFHHRLLQHDLAQPDAIWVGLLSRWISPRQVTPVAVVPVEQEGCDVSLCPVCRLGC